MENFRAPELFIDKDGLWYADGVLMINNEIIKLFASHLKNDGHKEYHIDWQGHLYPVRVEDVPFFVPSLTGEDGQLIIQLYDGRRFPMPLGSILMKSNIPYISLFWQRDTKLSRPAYAELCKSLIEREGQFFIKYGDNEWLVEEIV
ncbi:DUF1285 domain-containing protein [Desulfosporosinus meridiei]|uniref:DUF1285 domain-containing protein n=1 Tax=Desulfosporosinus meridiei (strain ATCC BAA-275 / DSM 13257 / KCTC 12902 / NCIMB 13706 / S10) TaxID=768704 RepID=J7J1A3_DESMD|nr:DUF1285 domain-containing protein [Desulfosporosinus meridiei]AFQ45098.1 hypothetical protein Desmer_3218 [Desulfosporosinus meridiei DSM 13257]